MNEEEQNLFDITLKHISEIISPDADNVSMHREEDDMFKDIITAISSGTIGKRAAQKACGMALSICEFPHWYE